MSNDKIKYGTVELPDDAFNDENAMVPLKIHNRSRAKVLALTVALRQAKEAILCAASAVDTRSPAYREIEKALELIKGLGI